VQISRQSRWAVISKLPNKTVLSLPDIHFTINILCYAPSVITCIVGGAIQITVYITLHFPFELSVGHGVLSGPCHTLQKPAPEIGAIGLNSTLDSGQWRHRTTAWGPCTYWYSGTFHHEPCHINIGLNARRKSSVGFSGGSDILVTFVIGHVLVTAWSNTVHICSFMKFVH